MTRREKEEGISSRKEAPTSKTAETALTGAEDRQNSTPTMTENAGMKDPPMTFSPSSFAPLSYEDIKNSDAPYLTIQHAVNGRLREAIETVVDSINTTKSQLRKYYESQQQGDEKGDEHAIYEKVIYHESLAPLYDLYGTTLMSLVQISSVGDHNSNNSSNENGGSNDSNDNDFELNKMTTNDDVIDKPTKEERLQWVTTAGTNLELACRILKSMIAKQNKVAVGGNGGDYFWMELASIHDRLGEFYRHNGSIHDAIVNYEECLKIRERFLEIFDENLAHTNVDLADMYLLAFYQALFDEKHNNEENLKVTAADISANIAATESSNAISNGFSKGTAHLNNGAVVTKVSHDIDTNMVDDELLDHFKTSAANHYLAAARSIASLIAIHCGADPSIIPIPEVLDNNNHSNTGKNEKSLPSDDQKPRAGKTAGLDDDEHDTKLPSSNDHQKPLARKTAGLDADGKQQQNGKRKWEGRKHHDDYLVKVLAMKDIHDIVKMLTIEGGSLNVVMELQDELDRLFAKVAEVYGRSESDNNNGSSDDDENVSSGNFDEKEKSEGGVETSKPVAEAASKYSTSNGEKKDEHSSKRLKKG